MSRCRQSPARRSHKCTVAKPSPDPTIRLRCRCVIVREASTADLPIPCISPDRRETCICRAERADWRRARGMRSGDRAISIFRLEPGLLALPLRLAPSAVTRRRAGISRPPIGAVWGWAQVLAGRTATGSLLPGGALVLSPHQDDETIGCGLLIAEKASRGIPIAVAVATDGRAGWFSATTRPDPDDITEIRHREWHQALDTLGVPPADRFELEFRDGELSDHEDELTEKLGDLFRNVRPSQVFVTRLRRSAPRSPDPGQGRRTSSESD